MDLPGPAWVAARALASQLLGFPYGSSQQPPPKLNNLQGAQRHWPQRLVTDPVWVFGEESWFGGWRMRHVRLSLCHFGVLATHLSFSPSVCLSILLASSAFGVSAAIFIPMLGLSYSVITMNRLPIFCPFFIREAESTLQTWIRDEKAVPCCGYISRNFLSQLLPVFSLQPSRRGGGDHTPVFQALSYHSTAALALTVETCRFHF